MKAAARGHTETVEALKEMGADLNIKDEDGQTALMKAAIIGRAEIVKALEGADLDIKDRYGQTTLMLVATKGQTEIVKALKERGAI
jgi:ankyrin repeat protein